MASRVRVAASTCLVLSGLFIGGAGGAIALADPGYGYGTSEDRSGDDSIGDIVRRAFGMDDGNAEKASEPGQRPQTRWGNSRTGENPGENEPPKTGTTTTRESPPKEPPPTTKPEEPPTKTPCPEPTPTQRTARPARADPAESTAAVAEAARIVQLPRFEPPSVPDMELPTNCSRARPACPAGLPCSTQAQVRPWPRRPWAPRCPSPCL